MIEVGLRSCTLLKELRVHYSKFPIHDCYSFLKLFLFSFLKLYLSLINKSFLGETQVDELAMELLLLLVVLPAVQDQNHTREWLKNAIRAWCSAAAWILDLRSYLFGDTPEDLELVAEAAAQDDQQPGVRINELAIQKF